MHIAALSAVPWKEVIKAAPMLVAPARRLYESLRKRDDSAAGKATSEPDSLSAFSAAFDEMRSSLDALEASETTQAKLISQMAAQGEALSRGLRAVSARQTMLMWLSGAALVIAPIGIVVAVLR